MKLHWFFKACLVIVFILILGIGINALPNILSVKKISGEVRGLIFQNQIWSGEIFITGDLVTLPNVWITVEPGTRIFISKSADKNNFDFLPSHLDHGVNTGPAIRGVLTGEPFWDEKEKILFYLSHLKALGEKDPIVITSAGTGGSPYDINLIKVEDGELSNVYLSNYRRLEVGSGVKIRNSYFENTGECAICIGSGSPLIENNIFKKGKRDFINIEDATPLILNNKFLDSEGDGLLIQAGSDKSIRIFNNFFQMPSKKAVKVLTIGQKGDISGNDFVLGDIDLPCNNKIRLINNRIRVKVLFNSLGGCSGEYTIFENYWEIADIQGILNARISKPSDKFQVRIPKILKSPPKWI